MDQINVTVVVEAAARHTGMVIVTVVAASEIQDTIRSPPHLLAGYHPLLECPGSVPASRLLHPLLITDHLHVAATAVRVAGTVTTMALQDMVARAVATEETTEEVVQEATAVATVGRPMTRTEHRPQIDTEVFHHLPLEAIMQAAIIGRITVGNTTGKAVVVEITEVLVGGIESTGVIGEVSSGPLDLLGGRIL